MSDRKTLEKNLWKWLREADLGDLHLERVENSLGFGFPDVDGQLSEQAFKIELKTAARPKSPTTPVRFKFQHGQAGWLRNRWKIGGRVWLLCQVGSGHGASRYLIRGYRAPEVEAGMTEGQLLAASRILQRDDAATVVTAAAYGPR